MKYIFQMVRMQPLENPENKIIILLNLNKFGRMKKYKIPSHHEHVQFCKIHLGCSIQTK